MCGGRVRHSEYIAKVMTCYASIRAMCSFHMCACSAMSIHSNVRLHAAAKLPERDSRTDLTSSSDKVRMLIEISYNHND